MHTDHCAVIYVVLDGSLTFYVGPEQVVNKDDVSDRGGVTWTFVRCDKNGSRSDWVPSRDGGRLPQLYISGGFKKVTLTRGTLSFCRGVLHTPISLFSPLYCCACGCDIMKRRIRST